MSLPHLPTSWNLYNLNSSPYFQGTLENGETSIRPLSLFVGRVEELSYLRGRIHGAGQGSSRQAIAGVPGVGKTTLVQELKATVLQDGYLATDELVPVLPGDVADSLFGRVLGALYDTILVNRPQSHGSAAMQAAQLLVRTAKLGTGGANISMMEFGLGGTKGTIVVAPKDILIDGPRIMRDLMALVRASDARGVLLHLNNLENLSESDTKNAGEILRSLRDLMLLHDGLHYVVVGTTDAVNVVVNQHTQVRTIFDTLMLEPLAVDDVHRMLAERYKYLRSDETRPVVSPVADEAVAKLYGLYRGDLRGLLKALDDGVGQLIGLAGIDDAERSPTQKDQLPTVRPLTLDELRPVLQRRYAAHLASLSERGRVEQLTAWGKSAPTENQTQKKLVQLWKVTQGAVSNALTYLINQGYVVQLPKTGASPTEYVLSGVSRLIFG
jgi:hypothetical protein